MTEPPTALTQDNHRLFYECIGLAARVCTHARISPFRYHVKTVSPHLVLLTETPEVLNHAPPLPSTPQSLETLTKNDISEMKGMQAPPQPVKLVMLTVVPNKIDYCSSSHSVWTH